MATKVQLAEQAEARDTLRELLKPGDTVFTTVRHVSRSGMMRAIDAYKVEDGEPRWLSRLVARAGVGSWSGRYEAVRMDGCGMDMGFALVYNLAQTLWPDGFDCIGEDARCPSNDHSNDRGTRDYSPTRHHRSGGYALNQRWL